ncbi:MAG: Vgb family protein [Candidatus Dormibacteria bacterium]
MSAAWLSGAPAARAAAIPPSPTVMDYQLPTTTAGPWGIATGPDGNLWVAENGNGCTAPPTTCGDMIARVTPSGQVTEYAIPPLAAGESANPVGPEQIIAGPDGAMWFTERAGGNIGRIDPSTGVITQYPVATDTAAMTALYGLTVGPDGNIWFTANGGANYPLGDNNSPQPVGLIGYVTTSGAVTDCPLQATETSPNGFPSTPQPQYITTGPDHNLWFTDYDGTIGRLTPDCKTLTLFPIPYTGVGRPIPFGITTGPDGNLWFTVGGATTIGTAGVRITSCNAEPCQTDTVGKISVTGVFTEYQLKDIDNQCCGSNSGFADITTGPDGALWFTSRSFSRIIRMTTDGHVTNWYMPIYEERGFASAEPVDITRGPDGAMWTADMENSEVTRVATSPLPTIWTEPACAAPGSSVDIWGSGFFGHASPGYAANSIFAGRADFIQGAQSDVAGSATPAADGTFEGVPIMIPANAVAGPAQISYEQGGGGYLTMLAENIPFTVGCAPTTAVPEWPIAPSLPMAGLACATLVAARRSRRRTVVTRHSPA